MPDFHYTFLPFIRHGRQNKLTNTELEALRPELTEQVLLREEVSGRECTIPKQFGVEAPLDAAAIPDLARYVARTDPATPTAVAGRSHLATTLFEPEYLPLVEFSPPVLWDFTPVAPQVVEECERLTPWVFLATLENSEFDRVGSKEQARVIEVLQPGASLPSPETLWAWAHVRLVDYPGDRIDASTPAGAMELARAHPELTRGVLIGSRRLKPDTHYYAFVLSSYESCRRQRTGEPLDNVRGDDLIDVGPTNLRFRPYHAFEFRTGAGGDFESLVSKLRPSAAPSDLGVREVDFSSPGTLIPGIDRAPGNQTMGVLGAMTSLSTAPTPWPNKGSDPFRLTVAEVLEQGPSGIDAEPDDDPLFLPSAYGSPHRSPVAFDDIGDWFTEVNLDPRLRATAHAGYRVADKHRADIIAKAWAWGDPQDVQDQEGLPTLLSELRSAELGRLLAERLSQKHFDRLNSGRFLQVASRLGPRVLEDHGTFADLLGARPEVRGMLSDAMRSIARPRALTRKWATAVEMPDSRPLHEEPPTHRLGTNLPPAIADGFETTTRIFESSDPSRIARVAGHHTAADQTHSPASFGSFLAGRLADGDLFVPPLAALDGAGAFGLSMGADGSMTLSPANGGPIADDPLRTTPPLPEIEDIGALGAALSEGLKQIADKPRSPAVPSIVLDELAIELREKTNPRLTIANWVLDSYTFATELQPTVQRLDKILAHPEFSTPIVELLTGLSREILIPGIGKVPSNSCTVLATNPEFVSAVMLAINQRSAMNLLMARYPSDMLATYFQRFWSSPDVVEDKDTDDVEILGQADPRFARDIPPIHTWTPEDGLAAQTTNGGARNVVLLVKAEVLARYPDTLISAQTSTTADPLIPTDAAPYWPIFSGKLATDVKYVGFEFDESAFNYPGIVFTFTEPIVEARYGLDAKPPESVDTWADAAWSHVVGEHLDPSPAGLSIPLTMAKFIDESGAEQVLGLRWARDSADVAAILYQQPFRIRVHSDDLIDA